MKFDIGKRVRQLRAEKGYTDKAFMEVLGMKGNGYLTEVENNRISPTWRMLEKIISAFGITITHFFSEPTCYIQEHHDYKS